MELTPNLTIRPTYRKELAFAGALAVLGVVSIALIPVGHILGWLGLPIFALAIFLFAYALPSSSCLTLTPEGLVARQCFRSTFYKWSEVTEFAPGNIGDFDVVVFNFTEEHQLHRRSRRPSGTQYIVGAHRYGHSAESLAEILNSWRLGVHRLDP